MECIFFNIATTERGSTIYTEFRGAISTFLTVAYILAVNPRILADSGGTCEYGEGGPFSPEYELCLEVGIFIQNMLTLTWSQFLLVTV
jgi:xanthine/uracil/vitamin C permease (AzgA family)